MGIFYFFYFAVGLHPQRLCFRGFRRSALLLATVRLEWQTQGEADPLIFLLLPE